VDDAALTLTTGVETLGSWGFDAVEVRRTAGDRFALDLAGENLVFIADNPVDFAYSVPGWVEAHKPKRRRGAQRRLEKREAELVDRVEKSGGRRRGISRRRGIQGRLAKRKAELVNRIEKSGGRRHNRKIARSAEHEHVWSEQSLPGGLIRRLCIECDHVSIDLRDADLPEEMTRERETPSTTP
jgi:hypothetical protein